MCVDRSPLADLPATQDGFYEYLALSDSFVHNSEERGTRDLLPVVSIIAWVRLVRGRNFAFNNFLACYHISDRCLQFSTCGAAWSCLSREECRTVGKFFEWVSAVHPSSTPMNRRFPYREHAQESHVDGESKFQRSRFST